MKTIHLPEPAVTGGMPLMEALSRRRTARTFSGEPLDLQTLSNLLWSAWGYNRERKRTAPSSHNRQEIELYLAFPDGVYLWNAVQNVLIQVLSSDLRKAAGMQEFVGTAPVEIIFVAETSRITGKDERGIVETIFADTGLISENIYLYCASAGLITVLRAMVDRAALSSAMGLRDDQMITLVQTVGKEDLTKKVENQNSLKV